MVSFNEKMPSLGDVIATNGKRGMVSGLPGLFTNNVTILRFDSCDYFVPQRSDAYELLDRHDTVVELFKQALAKKTTLRKFIQACGHPSTVGGDPEIFLTSANNVVFPAFKFLPLGKTATYDLFADGFAAEMNLIPGNCLSYVVDSAHTQLANLHRKMQAEKLFFSRRSVVKVPEAMMMQASDKEVQLGCAPTLNVYGLQPQLAPPREQLVRSAGGHLHFSMIGVAGLPNEFKHPSDETLRRLQNAVRGLDAVLGVMCVSLFAKLDDPRRRLYYGQAGEYRLPAHGLEYRVLSNAWLLHPVLMHMVYDLGRAAAGFGLMDLFEFLDGHEQAAQIIQDCDVRGARDYMTRNRAVLQEILASTHLAEGKEWDGAEAFEKFYAGAHTFIAEPRNVAKNWKLDTINGWHTHSEGHNCSWHTSQESLLQGEML